MEPGKNSPARIVAQSVAGGKNIVAETYAEDMAEVLENDKEGLIKKIIHGEEQHEEEKRNLSPESKKNKLFMLAGILLLALALLIFSFLFLKKEDSAVPIEKQFTPIIFNDQSTFLEIAGLKKDEIIQTVLHEVNSTKVKIGGIEGIYLTENKQIIGLRRFVELIKGNFAPVKNPLLVSDNFLLGAMLTGLKSTAPTAGNFFILLKVRSIADVFDALRSWEGKMLADLHGFLGIDISSGTDYLFKKNFEDSIIENKNARVLYDQGGRIILMYIFADENSIIITDSQPAAREIMLRLASAQKKQ